MTEVVKEKKYNFLKFLGIVGATVLITFGSLQNIWRTIKLAWSKIVKE
ncbi:MAG: hypothetical protein WC784_01535 [Candidatus Shapirobacteria bacterium]|jgi:hypothetical protein